MGYGLGVDLGTSFTGVAIGRYGRTRIVPLSDDPISESSLVAVRSPGSLLVREVDETVPVVLGGRPYPAVAVLAEALRSALTTVIASEGEAPEQVVLTCPAVWGPSRRQQFGEVSRRAGLTSVTVVSEPEAAVTGLVDGRRLVEDDVVLVYDIGGVTVDLTVVRVTDSGMEILGLPESVGGAGGADFDDLILAHVDRLVGGALSELDLSDPVAVGVLTGARAESVRAKETLSRFETATVRVNGLAEVVGLAEEMEPITLARSDFEALIRASLTSTLAGLRRVLDSAGVQPADLTAVVLVGGSSRIPLVSRMLTKSLARPLLVDEHPQHCVALGAAALASGTSTIVDGAQRITPGAPPVTNSIPTVAAATAIAAAAKSAESRHRAEARGAGGRAGKNQGTGSAPEKSAGRKPDDAPEGRRGSGRGGWGGTGWGGNDRNSGSANFAVITPTVAPPSPSSALSRSLPPVDKMLAATFPGAAEAVAASSPALSRRAGGHRRPGLADWRRWFDAERYSVQQRRWRVIGATAVTALLIGGATYALSPSGPTADAVNLQVVNAPYAPTTTVEPAVTSTQATTTGTSTTTSVATTTGTSTTTSALTPARAQAPTAPPTSPKRSRPPFRPIGATATTPSEELVSGAGRLVGLDGRCLDVVNGRDADGTAVQIFECNGSTAQLWTAAADGTLRAQSKCLQVADSRARESRLEINTCSGRGNQQWKLSSGNVVNPASRKCLDVHRNNSADRTLVIMDDCRDGPGQSWSLRS